MHDVLIVIDPQYNKLKDFSESEKQDIIDRICDRVRYHAENISNDIYGTIDKRYTSDAHPFIFKKLTQAIIDLPNVHIPIQTKYNLGSLDMVNQVVKLHNKYEHEGGVKVEIIGCNSNYECFIMAMTLKTLIAKIEVEMNLACIAGRLDNSLDVAKSIGINLVEL